MVSGLYKRFMFANIMLASLPCSANKQIVKLTTKHNKDNIPIFFALFKKDPEYFFRYAAIK